VIGVVTSVVAPSITCVVKVMYFDEPVGAFGPIAAELKLVLSSRWP
jgi:hypothetical protein